MAMLTKEDKDYINETLDKRFAEFEKKFDAKFTKLIDHMNDQFSRILGYVEGIDQRLCSVEKKVEGIDQRLGRVEKQTGEIPVVLARLETNETRVTFTETTHRDHECRISKLEAAK